MVLHAAYRKSREGVVDATLNVVDAVTGRGCGLVHCSSDVVFAGDGTWRGEADPPAAVSDYGRWKAAAEQVVTQAVEDAAIVRLPLVVAVDEPRDATTEAILAAATDGTAARWYDGEMRMPAWADDVADALWRVVCLEPSARGGIWHLAGARPLSRRALADRIARRLDLDPAVNVTVPAPPVTERPHDLRLTDRRARRDIGWDPRPVR